MLKYLKKSFAADEEEPKTSIWSKLKSANPKTAPSSEGRAFNARHAGSKNRKKQDSSEQNEKKGSKFDRRDDKAATKGSDDSRNPNVFAYSWEVGYEDKLVDAMEKSAEFEARQSEAMKQQAARLEDDDDDDFGTPFPEEEEEEEDEDEIRRRRRFVSYTIDDDIAEFEEAAMGEESDDSDDSEDDDTIVVNKTDHDDDDTEEEMEEGRDDDDVDGKRKPSKKKKDDEDEDGELDEIEDALLNGEEKIDFRNGELVWDDEDDELDDMDELLAEVWVQSSKSADGTFTMVHHSDRAKHVQLPKPRTLLEMLEAIEPQIPPEVTHPLAKEFFLNSWEVNNCDIYIHLFVYCLLSLCIVI